MRSILLVLLHLSCGLCLVPGTVQSSGRFDTPWLAVPSALGASSVTMASGDLNADGRQDVVFLSLHGTTVSAITVHLGQDSLFSIVDTYSFQGEDQWSLSLGDLDQDAHLDVITTTAREILVYLGNGTGTLQPAVSTTLFRPTASPVVALLTGGTLPDVVVTAASPNEVLILSGPGDGTLSVAASLPIGGLAHRVFVEDVDNDGLLDIVTLDGLGLGLIRNLGMGQFATEERYVGNTVGATVSGAVDDIDLDGDPDLVIVSDAGQLTAFKNEGPFPGVREDQMIPGEGGGVGLGDLNGDGLLDVVLGGPNRTDPVRTFLNTGTGTPLLNATETGAYGAGVGDPLVGDYTGDGRADVAVRAERGIAVVRGSGNGDFDGARQHFAGQGPTTLMSARFDFGATPDFMYLVIGGLAAMANEGAGELAAPITYAVAERQDDGLAVDLNNDGLEDAVVMDNTLRRLHVLLNGGGSLSEVATPISYEEYANDFASGDINGDGCSDVVVAGSSKVMVFHGTCDGGFIDSPPLGILGGALAVVDIVGDSALDLVIAGIDLTIHIGAGDGSFTMGPSYVMRPGAPREVRVADVTGDGVADLAVLKNGSGELFVGLGGGGFESRGVFRGGVAMDIGDVDGDGAQDILVATEDEIGMAVNYGVAVEAGQSGFALDMELFPAGDAPTGIVAEDVDGDGWIDCAVTNPGSGRITVLQNRGDKPTPVLVSGLAVEGHDGELRLRWWAGDVAEVREFRVHRSLDTGAFEVVGSVPTLSDGEYHWQDFGVTPGIRYRYRLEVVRRDGASLWEGPVVFVVPLPGVRLAWRRAVPNPFNDAVVLELETPERRATVVSVCDVTGHRVADLNSEPQGNFVVVRWDGHDSRGRIVPSGVYLVHARLEAQDVVRRIVLIK